jgi:DNA-binding transcriptional LysR family regulator
MTRERSVAKATTPPRTATRTPAWELYRSFLAVVRQGTLSAAARELSLTQPTIGRHIDALERELGVGLFTRSPSGLTPTGTALDLVPHAESMASAAEALVRAASGQAEDEIGSVRLTASELVGIEIVIPMLAAFREAHPRIAVEVVLSSRAEDLLRREADIAVRLFRPTQASLLAKRVGAIGIGLYAHPSYLESHPKPRRLEDLRTHALVGFDSEVWLRRGERYALPTSRDDYALRCDSYLGQYAAVRHGFGIGVSLHAPARRDELVRVLPRDFDVGFDAWLVMHEDLKTSRRVRLLYEFLSEQLTEYAATDGRTAPPRRKQR